MSIIVGGCSAKPIPSAITGVIPAACWGVRFRQTAHPEALQAPAAPGDVHVGVDRRSAAAQLPGPASSANETNAVGSRSWAADTVALGADQTGVDTPSFDGCAGCLGVYRRQAERDVWLPGPNAGRGPGVEIVQVNPKFVQYGGIWRRLAFADENGRRSVVPGRLPPRSQYARHPKKNIDLIDKIVFRGYYIDHG
jgi:hypothetical protein